MSISAFRRVFIPLLVGGLALALFALSSGTTTRADPLVGPTFAPIIKTNTCNGLPNDFQAPVNLQGVLRGPNSRASGAGCTGASTAPSSHPILDVFFDIPRNDLMYNQGYWLSTQRGITLNDQSAIPQGALIGGLSGQVSLGLLASFCQDKFSTPDFIWWKGTSDNVGSVLATQPDGTPNRWSTIVTDVGGGVNGTGADGLADNNSPIVSGYPDFLNKMFDPDGNGVDNGTLGTRPVTPVARYAGASTVPAGGDWQTLQVVIFNASDLQAAYSANSTTINHPFAKLTPAVGLVTFIILNDPTSVIPSVQQISDFCTSLIVNGMQLGEAWDVNGSEDGGAANSCADGIDNGGGDGADYADSDCRINRVTAAATPGSYMSQVRTQSLRDLDGDGVANDEDSCPYTFNVENFMTNSGPDGDMLDSACDPTPSAKSRWDPTNQEDGNNLPDNGPPAQCNDTLDNDGDTKVDIKDPDCQDNIASTDIDNDGYENAQDPCPLVQNSSPLDSEPGLAFSTAAPDGGPPTDSIGDQCDTHPTVADGDWFNVIYIDSICITSNAAVDDTDNDGWCENDGDNNDTDPGTGIHFEAGPGGVFTDQYPDATDPDGDSTVYTVANSNQEWAVGVDALNACPLIAGHDTWPPDFSRLAGDNVPDGKSDIFDISLMTPPVFGKSAGQTGYVQRLDLSRLAGDGVPDGKIDIFDISLLTPPVFGKTSLPGGCPALKGH